MKGVYLNTGITDGTLTQAQVGARIQWWRNRGFTGLSLKGTVGSEDPGTAGGTPHNDDAAVWNALIASGFADVRGYTEDVALRHGISEASVAFLRKPVTPHALLRMLRELLGQPA